MRKGGLWKKTVSILLVTAMVLTAVPVSASGFGEDEAPQAQGMMEEVPLGAEDVEEDTEGAEEDFQVEDTYEGEEDFPVAEEGFEAEEMPEGVAEFRAEDVEGVSEFADESELLAGQAAENGKVECGGLKFDTLSDAIPSLYLNGSEGEIKLLADIDITDEAVVIPSGMKIVLELNGHTITAANTENGNIDVRGNLIVRDNSDNSKNGTGNGKIHSATAYNNDIENGFAVISVTGSGNFELDSGYIQAVADDASTNGNVGVSVTEYGIVTINGGKIEAGWYTISGNGEENEESTIFVNGGTLISKADYAIYYSIVDGGLQIHGGTIQGAAGAVAMRSGYLNITGGTFRIGEENNTGNRNEGTSGLGNAVINLASDGSRLDAVIVGGTFTGGSYPPLSISNEVTSLFIYGGTFTGSSVEVIKRYFPKGFSIDEFGTVSDEQKRVARIDTQLYTTLQEAIDAGGSGDLIVLLKDIDITEEGISISKEKDAWLDLSGHTITAANSAKGNIHVLGSLYIEDETDTAQNGSGKGKICSSTDYDNNDKMNTGVAVIAVAGDGFLELRSGCISAVAQNTPTSKYGNFGITVANNASVYIDGGKVEAGWYAISGNGDDSKNTTISISGGKLISKADYAIYHPGYSNNDGVIAGTLYIHGGEITGAAGAVAMRGGSLGIFGGTCTSEGTGATLDWGNGTSGLGDAAVNIDSNYSPVEAKITGGTFTAPEGKPSIAIGESTPHKSVSLSITGGTYSDRIDEAYLAPGYMQSKDTKEVELCHHLVRFEIVCIEEVDIAPPDYQWVGHNMTAAKPYFSPEGYQVLGWYSDAACSEENKWNFATPISEDETIIYIKIEKTSTSRIKEVVDAVVSSFNRHCADLQNSPLTNAKLADLTETVLKSNPGMIEALKGLETKTLIKSLLDDLQDAASEEELNAYFAEDTTHRKAIDNLRAIQGIVFAVEAAPTLIENNVRYDLIEVKEPQLPADITEEERQKIEDTLNNKNEMQWKKADLCWAIVNNNILTDSSVTPQSLANAVKSSVTEPSVVFVEAALKDLETEAVVEKSETGEYKISLIPTKLEFEVTPYKQRAQVNENGEIVGPDAYATRTPIANGEIKESVTFYLPLPSWVTKLFVKITHDGKLMGTYPVKSKQYVSDGVPFDEKYVEVTTDAFSPFVLEFTNDSGYIPPAVSYYNVAFDSQGGSAVPAINSVRAYSTIAKPANPTKENFVFGGWFKDAACTQAWEFAKDTVTGNLTLYAKWTEEEPETVLDPVVVKVDSRTTNTVKISWSESARAEGYTVWARAEDQTGYKRVAITSKDDARTFTWKKREPGTKHFFVVKAWIKDEDGKYVFSEASKTVRGTTKPETAKIKKVTVNAAGDLKVTLVGPAKGANRYAMCWSRKADFSKYAIGIRTQYTSRTMVKGLKPGTCYVKVRSYRQMGESRVYGDWSEMVKVTF